ncbi:MAG: Fic family protein [Candidatus Micrarchaeota archaeon]
MVHLSVKKIKGKPYLYAVKSIRLPNGKIHKLAKLIKKSAEARSASLMNFFEQREAKLCAAFCQKYFLPFRLRGEAALEKIEQMRLDYKKILAKLSPNQLSDLFDRFTVNFTYESNALEGNSLTLKDVAIVIRENVAIKGKELREIYETRNSREVVGLILKRKLKVSEKDVLKMHSMLVRDMDIPVGYKTVPNYLHGRQVVTTPPEQVASMMKELFAWFEENKKKMHPLHLASRFHTRFERIHPFEDGNGRVGRFLINIILVNNSYPPLIIRKTQRVSYFNALEDADNGRFQAIDQFFFERLTETHEKFFKIYVKYLK